MATNPYLIWSTLHRAWWRPKAAGYTADIESAGVFRTPEPETFDSKRERAVYLDEARELIRVAQTLRINQLAQLRSVEAGLLSKGVAL